MEVSVQLGRNKNVIKYDNNWNEIKTYNSVIECLQETNVCEETLRKRSKNKIQTNGYYYIYQDSVHSEFIKCEQCGKEFNCQPWRIREHKHLFCSTDCSKIWKATHKKLNCTCDYCGKLFYKKPSDIKKSIKNYCSTICANEDKRTRYLGENNHQYGVKGSKNASWKSDERISPYGYRLIRSIDHPFKNIDEFVFEHKLVAEKFLLTDSNSVEINGKKYLKQGYVVHHLNFDRLDNNVNNLLVLKRKDHTSLHYSLRDENKLKEYCTIYNLCYNQVIKNIEQNKKYYRNKSKKGSTNERKTSD